MPTKTSKKKIIKTNTSNVGNKHSKRINKKGGGLNDTYNSKDYKDSGMFDALKFSGNDRLSTRGDMPPFPGCVIS